MEKDDFKKLIAPLEDFSKNPPSDLWEAIEEKLEEPKKKRVFAYWWSVAASLIVGLGLLGAFYFQSSNEKHTNGMPLPVTPHNGIVNQSRSLEENNSKQEIQAQDKNQKNQIVYPKSNKENNNQAEENLTHLSAQKGAKSITSLYSHHQLAAATTIRSKVLNAEKQQQNQSEKNTISNPALVQENPNSVVEKSATENPNNAIKPKEDLKQNALAALANENQKKEKKSTVEDRWSLQLFAGINNSQNLKNQKSLGNSIESQKGYNYGVKTNYKLNKRWAVSTGLKISELGQQVANVSYLNASQSLVNVNQFSYAAPKDKQGITSNSNYIFVPTTTSYEKSNVSTTIYESGNLSQRVQYIEMPMEISYSILNKGKARLNLNTGGFVGRVISNKVALDNTAIGKNSDVNETVFGTVLSSTLQYELYKKTRVFVEPGMNFYTQPVQNQNFNQFQMLLNFGFNISF